MYAAGTVKALIAEVEKTELLQVDSKGRSSDDRNYFGLVRSLVIGMRRMITWCDGYDARSGSGGGNTKKMVIGLLMAMSMLHSSRTPTSLFADPTLAQSGTTPATNPHLKRWSSHPFAPLFSAASTSPGRSNFELAQTVLQRHGFLLPSDDAGSEYVGVMHQLVQRAVRQHIMAPDTPGIPPSWARELLDTLEVALRAQYWFEGWEDNDFYGSPNTLPRLRRLGPCVQQWFEGLCRLPVPKHLCGREAGALVLMHELGSVFYRDGALQAARGCHEAVLKCRKRVLPADDPAIGNSMTSLGLVYSALGLHSR